MTGQASVGVGPIARFGGSRSIMASDGTETLWSLSKTSSGTPVTAALARLH
jgi:hypothetical protein